MKVGIKGPGDRIKWVDIQDLPVTKELVKFKKETADTIKRLSDELAETKQELKGRIKDLEYYVALKEGGKNEEDII